MDQLQAQRAIESLRRGIPPDGWVRAFTVGRRDEINRLAGLLRRGGPAALLLKADYGSGKTHLLRFLREMALDEGYAVSYIALDSKSAVRFNRMDQIFGAAIRHVCVPGKSELGPGALFGAVLDAMTSPCADVERKRRLEELSSMGRWDYSRTLKSPALFIGLRAWIVGTLNDSEHPLIPREVEGWLCEPWNYYTRTSWLYDRFVLRLRAHFRDPRAPWQFYRRGVDTFVLKASDYGQSWDALGDLDTLARLAGLRGLVLLVDEFEDVIYNLKRVDYQDEAFWNLFRLFGGDFPGLSFYAVTPGFANKCKVLLLTKGYWDYDYSRFDALPTFEMSPLSTDELADLAMRILETHGVAYRWEPDLVMKHSQLSDIVKSAAAVQVPDRARQTIRRIVEVLDELLQDADVEP